MGPGCTTHVEVTCGPCDSITVMGGGPQDHQSKEAMSQSLLPTPSPVHGLGTSPSARMTGTNPPQLSERWTNENQGHQVVKRSSLFVLAGHPLARADHTGSAGPSRDPWPGLSKGARLETGGGAGRRRERSPQEGPQRCGRPAPSPTLPPHPSIQEDKITFVQK